MAGQFKFNKAGRNYIQGRAAHGDLRQLIVLDLLQNNADPITGQIPRGQQERTARKYRVGHDLVRRLWKRYVEDSDLEPKVSRSGQLCRELGYDELDLMEHLMHVKPSTPYSSVISSLQQNAVLPEGTSITAVSNVIHKELNMSYKRVIGAKAENFSPENIRYCEMFLNTMKNVHAVDLKFFDEAGINLQVCNPTYGHAEKGEVAIEIVPRDRGCQFTLMLLCSMEGIDYAKIIPRAANTIDFLAF